MQRLTRIAVNKATCSKVLEMSRQMVSETNTQPTPLVENNISEFVYVEE